MAIAIPIVVNEQLAGSGFIVGIQNGAVAVATALHVLGNGQNLGIALPPHMGDLSRPQVYPLERIPTLKATLALAEPLLDIAILMILGTDLRAPIPRFLADPREIRIGEEVLVVGYPYAVIGSILETAEPSVVSAIGDRTIGPNFSSHEFILARQTHPGSSGSAVIRRADGVVIGVLRGCLAPPGMLSIGNLPIGTDSSVTYTTSAHIVPALVSEAFEIGAWSHG